jgi:hypothetical protein
MAYDTGVDDARRPKDPTMLTLDPTTLTMDDPNATQDGSWTADDYLDPATARVLSALSVNVPCDPRELRGIVVSGAGEFNRAVRELKGVGRVTVTVDGMLWRHW